MFNIGDGVMIVEDHDGYCPYSITTPGSIGTILSFKDTDDPENVRVQWHTLTSWDFHRDQVYTVDPRYLRLTNESPAITGKYAKIIRKMKQMEAKRKALGYKTYGTT